MYEMYRSYNSADELIGDLSDIGHDLANLKGGGACGQNFDDPSIGAKDE